MEHATSPEGAPGKFNSTTALPASGSDGTLSFIEGRKQDQTPKRPAVANIVEGDHSLLRDVERPPPGDVTRMSKKSKSRQDLTRERSQYFDDAFSAKGGASPARERVQSESMVTAEVRTNVIINDEFTFITELSYQLSSRYQRPISCVAVTVQHGACMLFAGTFEPAYTMSLFALPTQVQPITNRRNAALIQAHMEEALGVIPSRGIVRFVATPEENVARGGKTLAGEIHELERAGGVAEDSQSVSSLKSKARKRLSVKSLKTIRGASSTHLPFTSEPTPQASAGGGFSSTPPIPPTPNEKPTQEKKARRQKSLATMLFARGGSKGGG